MEEQREALREVYLEMNPIKSVQRISEEDLGKMFGIRAGDLRVDVEADRFYAVEVVGCPSLVYLPIQIYGLGSIEGRATIIA